MSERGWSILVWVLWVGAGMGAGLLAARFRLFDSVIAVIGLGVLITVLIGVGIRTMMQPWDDDEE